MPDRQPAGAPSPGLSRRPRAALLALTVLAGLLAAGAVQARPPSARATYDALVKRARAGDRTVDVARLREAAGAAGVASLPDDHERLAAAARKGDARALAKLADGVLARNYADLWGHHFAAKAAAALGDARKEDHHRWLLVDLMNALTASGDGQSPETPMVIISDDEPSFLMQALHVELEDQGSATCRGHPCDVLKVKHQDGSKATWYFDVHIPKGRKAGR